MIFAGIDRACCCAGCNGACASSCSIVSTITWPCYANRTTKSGHSPKISCSASPNFSANPRRGAPWKSRCCRCSCKTNHTTAPKKTTNPKQNTPKKNKNNQNTNKTKHTTTTNTKKQTTTPQTKRPTP